MTNYDNLICEIADSKGWRYGQAERYFENALRVVGRATNRSVDEMKKIIDGMSMDQLETMVFGVLGAINN